MTTIRDALGQGTHTLAQAGQQRSVSGAQPSLDAQVLLSQVLSVERATLYAHPGRVLTSEQEQQFLELLERRRRGEPVAYLIGQKEFYDQSGRRQALPVYAAQVAQEIVALAPR